MVAVGYNTVEPAEVLFSFHQQQGYPWQVASTSGQMPRDFRVTVQSTKLILDSKGVVVYRANYGSNPEDRWREVLDGVVQ